MKLTLFKILYFFSLATMLFYLYTNIFNPVVEYGTRREINGIFVLSIISSIIFPFIIFYINNKNKWFVFSVMMIFLTLFCYINFKSDLLQKTIFINQPTSSYTLQKKTIKFIDNHQKIAMQLVEIIEEKLKTEKFENDIEIIIVNNSDSRFEKDEIITSNYKGKLVKRRIIVTDISKYGFSNNKHLINKFTIKDKKVQNLDIYSAVFYPYKVNEYDKNMFSPIQNVSESGNKYYIEECKIQSYIYKKKWLFKVGSDCKG